MITIKVYYKFETNRKQSYCET